jgi:hypothetical protein
MLTMEAELRALREELTHRPKPSKPKSSSTTPDDASADAPAPNGKSDAPVDDSSKKTAAGQRDASAGDVDADGDAEMLAGDHPKDDSSAAP